jgi:hypothetical protein
MITGTTALFLRPLAAEASYLPDALTAGSRGRVTSA